MAKDMQKEIDFKAFDLDNVLGQPQLPGDEPVKPAVDEAASSVSAKDDEPYVPEVPPVRKTEAKKMAEEHAQETKTTANEETEKEEGGDKNSEAQESGIQPDDREVDSGEGADQVSFKPFLKAFFDANSMEWKDEYLEEDNLEGYNKVIGTLIEANSVPEYASEETAAFDEFVKQGGSPKQYLETVYGQVDYSTVNLEKESDQERVVYDLIKKTNPKWDDQRVAKKIQTYKDTGVIKDEAADALEILKDYQEEDKQGVWKKLEAEKKANEEATKERINNLKNTIFNRSDIAGFKLADKDKQGFFDYVARPSKDGYTEYQKALAKDKEASLKMAYILYKNFDLESLKRDVNSELTREIRKNLSRYKNTDPAVKGGGSLREEPTTNLRDFVLPFHSK